MSLTKEAIYDASISPLMNQIIELCQTHGIAFIAQFATPTEAQPHLVCTTVLPDETGRNPVHHKIALSVLEPDLFANPQQPANQAAQPPVQ